MNYPRPLTQIHQIELTSRCNLACKYCINATMTRPRQDMSDDTYARALTWVDYFCKHGTQGELNLAGVGESFLHPGFADMVAAARRVVGAGRRILLATNGLSVTKDIVDTIKPYRPAIWVSLHRPERASQGLKLLQEAGLLAGISTDPATNPNDWGGQVDYAPGKLPEGRKTMACPWLRGGWGFVTSDGRILECCLDGSGDSCVGHVNEEPSSVMLRPWRLCASCYQEP